MNSQDFRRWIDDCIRNARQNGMTEREIYIVLSELVYNKYFDVLLQAANQNKGG